jgi:hypothetical protein
MTFRGSVKISSLTAGASSRTKGKEKHKREQREFTRYAERRFSSMEHQKEHNPTFKGNVRPTTSH